MSEVARFFAEVSENIQELEKATDLQALSRIWMREIARYKYSYNFTWMGRPIIQVPQDVMAMQELIWKVQPDVIVETGVAHGGSLIFYASMLELLGGNRKVVGVDIDIRPHNRVEIEKHPMSKRIKLIQGSSIDKDIVAQVKKEVSPTDRVLVVLDSNHTHEHVLEELRAYSPLVTKGSYCVVFDTAVEDMPDELIKNRPWKKGNNPKTAVWQFMKENNRFEIDRAIDAKLLISVAPEGYLKCIKE